jgi:hypothetical protein
MKPSFTVIGTPHYERLFKKLLRAHRDLRRSRYAQAKSWRSIRTT